MSDQAMDNVEAEIGATEAEPDTANAAGSVDGGERFDAPIRDVLTRLGFLSQDQVAKVQAHAAERGLDFDQSALELGFITTEDLDRARDSLINSQIGRAHV